MTKAEHDQEIKHYQIIITMYKAFNAKLNADLMDALHRGHKMWEYAQALQRQIDGMNKMLMHNRTA